MCVKHFRNLLKLKIHKEKPSVEESSTTPSYMKRLIPVPSQVQLTHEEEANNTPPTPWRIHSASQYASLPPVLYLSHLLHISLLLWLLTTGLPLLVFSWLSESLPGSPAQEFVLTPSVPSSTFLIDHN